MLKNAQRNDYRLYEVKVTVMPKPVRAQLELHCPARGQIEQSIPVYNNAEKDVMIKPTVTPGENSQAFHFPKDIVVKKKSQANYIVTFKPEWNLRSEAKLVLTNQVTGDVYHYEITGLGEEPLAEDHVILNCRARKKTHHEIVVRNYNHDRFVNYRVETDLHNASGPETLKIRPGGSEKYKFEITPVLGGVYTGSITFYDEDKYVWYTVEIRTDSPQAEKRIPLETQIRKAVAFDIALENPLDEKAEFEVILNGTGLMGEESYTLLPKQQGVYELIFSPLQPMRELGSIAFIHEKLGEIWYELELAAEDVPQVRLPTLQCELGKVATHPVELENPSNQDVKVKPRIQNMHNFDLDPEDIVIPRYSSVEI